MALPFSILDVTNLLGIMPRNNKIISNCYDINCPFCGDDKYHLNVNLSKGVWRCPKCGEFGNAITMYAKYRGICNQDAYAEIIEGLNLDHLDKIEFQKRAKKREVEEKKILKSERNPKGDREYNQVFSALFKLPELNLLPEHYEHLISRGISEIDIIRANYKTTPKPEYAYIVAHKLMQQGLVLEDIPGFYVDKYRNVIKYLKENLEDNSEENMKKYIPYKKNDELWAFNCYYQGIIIPTRDLLGRIVSTQIRKMNTDIKKDEKEMNKSKKKSPKYATVSSKYLHKGVNAYTKVHYVGRFYDYPETVYLTEGALKADIANALTGLPFVAIAGVNNEQAVLELLTNLNKLGIKTIVEVFDMDKYTNMHVGKAVNKIRNQIKEQDFNLKTIKWDPKYKGIDDYLAMRLLIH